MPGIESDYIYDGEELDPRLTVEVWEPSPYLPATYHRFMGMSFDGRGSVLCYGDGDNAHAKTYDMQIIFPILHNAMRVCNMLAEQESKISKLLYSIGRADGSSIPKFCALRCKYTNYVNWYASHSWVADIEDDIDHYMLAIDDALVEVLTSFPPKVIFKSYGLNVPKEVDLMRFLIADEFYTNIPPEEE